MTAVSVDRTTGLVPSTAVVAGRALRRFARTPQEIVAGTATMAMFILIFRYVFGGQIDMIGSLAYVDFLVPGYLATAALFTGMGTSAAVAEDLEQGVVDRLRSLPIPRTAFLAGRAVADTAVLVWSLAVAALVSFAIGFRIHGDALDVALAAVLLVVFGFAFVWLFIALGLFAGSAKGAQGLSFLVFPFTFVSSAYVQVETLPGLLRPFAEHQPLTTMINAVRGLVQGPAAEALLAHSTSVYVTRSLLWTLAILAVAVPLAVARYRRG
jgi:ABC-2 type transport system permease protein